jgi:hypothetical protein
MSLPLFSETKQGEGALGCEVGITTKKTTTMKKMIELSEETMKRLEEGKYVEGSLRMAELDAGKKTVVFRPYQRKRCGEGDKLIYRSANGWLKESSKRRKLWVSVKKDIGTFRGAVQLLAESKEMTEYLSLTPDPSPKGEGSERKLKGS